jgi:PAS domain S-box-containing protein
MGIVIALQLDPKLGNSLKKLAGISKVKKIDTEQHQQGFIQELENDRIEVDAVIIGSSIKDPISVAQRLHFINKNISVIILCQPENFHQMIDAVQFAPFLGEEVSCLSNENGRELSAKVKNAITNTRKRRDYQDAIASMNIQIPGQSSIQLQTARYFDRLLDFAPVGIVVVDNNLKVLAWNKKAEELFGKDERDVLGTPILSFFSKDEQKRFIDFISQNNISQTRTKQVFHREKQKGEQQVLEVNATYLNHGTPNYPTLIIFEDVTAKVEEERKRKLAEDNLLYLAEASKILSSSLDYRKTLSNIAKAAVPRIADWCAIDLVKNNGGLEQVTVVHRDPAKVKWAKELRKADPPDMNASQGLPKVIKTGEAELYPVISDELLVKVAKSQKHLQLLRSIGFTSAMIVPLCNEGKCIGAITFVTTETSRNYNKSDLAMAEELANRASLALDNAGLYKASQDAVTLRDNFISVASHELRTPVTSVKIFTQVLQKHSEQIGDEKAIKHLVKMDRQLNKLIELIYNLLNVSKIQAGRMEFAEKPFDFDASVKEIVDVLQEGVTKHQLIIKGATKKIVYGDEERIGQVISNLISNAIKYSPKADKVIIHLASDDNKITVCVEDFGIGLAKEHLGKIFERFYRVFDTTDKTFPGLGIGLYISAEIIRRHHGKLWVESDTGKGSKFSFSLPLQRDKKTNGVHVL